ncbi:MAG: ABC transporter ATP-binding protein [Candidatus Omnitrophota bacterium]
MSELLRVRGLSAGYGASIILSDIDLSIEQGSFVGIIGPNGSGKSTLLKSISRTLRPITGTVTLRGVDILRLPLGALARSIAVVSQETPVIFEYLVRDMVMMGRIPYQRRFGAPSSGDSVAVSEALRLTGTGTIADRSIHELSAGERQRVMLAKALAQRPELLILDEPTSHLDISHQVEILTLLRDLTTHRRMTIIAVLHDLNLASAYCDRLVLLDRGRVRTQGSPGEVLTYQAIEEAYKTVVLVKENPLTGRPHIFLVPRQRGETGTF